MVLASPCTTLWCVLTLTREELRVKSFVKNETFENARKFPNLCFSAISKSNMADMKKS